ncbi:hypothetical protein Poli38472_007277 [Pythium oligandrum]|uniref:BZIP domain-containing protein n=1 Tax=Pythium oligandrum TaxID=41045 RepID=A0A8K1FGW4_PYTOL|nr:hypothetical protein Poli38472_007277 [Pythium oligandrum]|eukprot:TMW59132.1 hypothetical protein Poli38472_007277 [Pythium oligandrum]
MSTFVRPAAATGSSSPPGLNQDAMAIHPIAIQSASTATISRSEHGPLASTSTSTGTASSWLKEEDVEHALGEFTFVENDMVDQILELFDPELMQEPPPPVFGSQRPRVHSEDDLSDDTTASFQSESTLSTTNSEEYDAAGRRKGGGRPQPLDGLSERKRQQILRRRVRNRESMRRMRARCKSSKEQLRQLEATLVERQEQATIPDVPANVMPNVMPPPIKKLHPANEMMLTAIRQKILELQHMEASLAQENASLKKEMDKYENALALVRDGLQELHLEAKPFQDMTVVTKAREDDFSWVDRVLPFLPQFANGYDVYELVRHSYEEVLVAARSAERYLPKCSNKVLGWRDTRMVNGTWVDFIFTKDFPSEDVEKLAQKTWELQSKFENVNSVMPQTHNMRILRKINDSALLCARNLVFPSDGTNYCHIYLLLRVKHEQGYVVAQRTLEPDNPEALQHLLGDDYSYVSVFYGLHIAPRICVDDDGTVVKTEGAQVKFGGRVGNGTVAYAKSWAMDVLVAILRWEDLCVAPILQLVSTATP